MFSHKDEHEQVDVELDVCIKGLTGVFYRPRSAIKSRCRGFAVGRGKGRNVSYNNFGN